MKFSTVASAKLAWGEFGFGFGLVKELKSNARPKFLGSCGMLTSEFSQKLAGRSTRWGARVESIG